MAYVSASSVLLTQDKRTMIDAKSFKYWSIAQADFSDKITGDFPATWELFGHFSKRDSLTVAVFDTEEIALQVLASLMYFIRNGEVADWVWPNQAGEYPGVKK